MINETPKEPVNINRRRLAKGGLAAPVLLATLASKNALANPVYRCTISGKLSGGSTHSTTESCDPGPSVANLQENGGNNLHWGDVSKDANFSSIFIDVYWVNKATPRLLRKRGGTRVATFREVMTLNSVTNSNKPHDVALGRAAIAAYVGWVRKGADYPLTLDQIKAMFASAHAASTYNYPGTGPTKANLNRQEVFDYFNFLAGGPEPTIIP